MLEERRRLRMGGGIGQDAPIEGDPSAAWYAAKRAAWQCRSPLEAIGQNGQIVALESRAHRREFLGAASTAAGSSSGQRRLCQH